MRGSGSNIGYRQMTERLVNDYGLVVDRETVFELLKTGDPEGVGLQAKRSLKRRQYRTKGHNFLWHIDGYDKLKPFGVCIHGAIDDLVGEFYGSMLASLTMIFLSFVRPFLTVLGEQRGL